MRLLYEFAYQCREVLFSYESFELRQTLQFPFEEQFFGVAGRCQGFDRTVLVRNLAPRDAFDDFVSAVYLACQCLFEGVILNLFRPVDEFIEQRASATSSS